MKLRIKRHGTRFLVEYKKHFFSSWKNISEYGFAEVHDGLKSAKTILDQFKKLAEKKLTEIVYEV